MASSAPPRVHRSFDPANWPEPERLARGVTLHRQGHYVEAAEIYQELERKHRPHPHARMMIALLFYQRSSDPHFPIDWHDGKTITPLELLRDVILMLPKWGDPRYNLGVMLEGMGRFAEAKAQFEGALKRNPEHAQSWVNLGNCLLAEAAPDRAKECFDKALGLRPDDELAKYNLMHALALFGDWDETWRLWEYRYTVPGHLRDHGHPVPLPQWDGHSYVPRLVVTDEQGAGDIIQWARFLPLLEASAGTVYFRCRHPKLVPLLRYNFPRVVIFGQDDETPDADAHIPLLSAINRLGIAEHDIPFKAGFLRTPCPEKNDRGGVSVGLCWAGAATHKRDGTRSISWDIFSRIADLPGIRFVNLTVGPRAEVEHPHLTQRALTDYTSTANLIAGLDLVLTVDTSVAHLASALGVPTWTLIAAAPDFRWGLVKDWTPWYRPMTLWRQPRAGAWEELIGVVTWYLEATRTQLMAAKAVAYGEEAVA